MHKSTAFFPVCPTDSKLALVQVMAWHQTGAKPLPEPMMTKTHEAIWHDDV